MTKEFKQIISGDQSNIKDDGFVTHQELSLVYLDIKDDLNGMDKKFTLEFAKTEQRFVNIDQEFVNVRREIHELDEKLTGEIRKTREEAHKELIEVKNEIMAEIGGVKTDVAELKGDVSIIKDYLFTKLTSDIKTVVMECFAEKGR